MSSKKSKQKQDLKQEHYVFIVSLVIHEPNPLNSKHASHIVLIEALCGSSETKMKRMLNSKLAQMYPTGFNIISSFTGKVDTCLKIN